MITKVELTFSHILEAICIEARWMIAVISFVDIDSVVLRCIIERITGGEIIILHCGVFCADRSNWIAL